MREVYRAIAAHASLTAQAQNGNLFKLRHYPQPLRDYSATPQWGSASPVDIRPGAKVLGSFSSLVAQQSEGAGAGAGAAMRFLRTCHDLSNA